MMFDLENLESRRLFSATVKTIPVINSTAEQTLWTVFGASPGAAHVSKTGTLIIQGTSKADQISLSTTKPSGTVNIIAPPFESAVETRPTIYLSSTTNGVTTQVGFDGGLDIKRIYIEGAAGNDNISVGDVKLKATILGGKGNDTLVGGFFGDSIYGGDGNDVIKAAGPNLIAAPVSAKQTVITGKLVIQDSKNTGASAIQYIASGSSEQANSADLLEGNAGNDTIYSGLGPDTVSGGAGSDTLVEGDRGTIPKGLISAGDKPVDFNGLTVISIEAIESNAITVKPTGSAGFQLIAASPSGKINAVIASKG